MTPGDRPVVQPVHPSRQNSTLRDRTCFDGRTAPRAPLVPSTGSEQALSVSEGGWVATPSFDQLRTSGARERLYAPIPRITPSSLLARRVRLTLVGRDRGASRVHPLLGGVFEAERVTMRLGYREPGLVVDLDAVPFRIEEVQPERVAVA